MIEKGLEMNIPKNIDIKNIKEPFEKDGMNLSKLDEPLNSSDKSLDRKSLDDCKDNSSTHNPLDKSMKDLDKPLLSPEDMKNKENMEKMFDEHPEMKQLFEKFDHELGEDYVKNMVVNPIKNGWEVSNKEYPATKMEIKGDTVYAKAGCISEENGEMNQFLNYPMPDKTYVVDGCFTYKLDNIGRVTEASSDRTKAATTLERSPLTNTFYQNKVVNDMDGIRGQDDSGHIFAHSTKGPNEMINQVPMNSSFNRNGEWRQNVEKPEENAISEGKQVQSTRKFTYEGDSRRPSEIEVIDKFDDDVFSQKVKNPI